MRSRFVIFVLCTALMLPAGVTQAQLPSGPVPGKFIVKLSDQADPMRLSRSLSQENRLTKLTPAPVRPDLRRSDVWKRWYVFVSRTQAVSTADVVAVLGKENIELIEPDYFLEFFGWPTDDKFSHQWYLNNTGQQYLGIVRVPGYENDYQTLKSGTVDKDIRLRGIYNNPPSESTRVVVAIVDTGVDPTHPELQGRFWRNVDEIPGNAVDDDHNGYIDDTLGYDVSGDIPNFFDPQGDNDPTDSNGHGTHIAGIVAANTNGVGVVGICPWADIMSVKIMPNATSSVGAAGIVYAVSSGAQVINISWGTPFESSVLREAIMFAEENGVLVCIAPGNTGDNSRFFPAAFDSVRTVVVAAGNSDGFMTDFSTFGAHIDIVAPGLDILSLRAAGTDMYSDPRTSEPLVRIVDNLYYLSDGTSMATPMVAGAAALLLSFRPDLSLVELEDILLRGATDLDDPYGDGQHVLPGPDTMTGHGYLNVDSSLSLLERGSLYIVEPSRRSRHTTAFTIKIAPVAGYTGSWQLDYSLASDRDNWLPLASGASVPTDSIAAIFTDSTVEGYINLRLTDRHGSIHTITVIHVRQNLVEITSPLSGEELDYSIPIIGSVYGPDFDSMAVLTKKDGDGWWDQ
ncbi:MAG: S8 family serine peptidase, partial [Candidatus Zixiibacteriota bacterium]